MRPGDGESGHAKRDTVERSRSRRVGERLRRGCMRGAQVVSLREVVRLRRVDGICQNGSFVRGKMLWQGF